MRLAPLLDSLLLGSLWGGLPNPQVCPSSLPPRPVALREVWAQLPRTAPPVTAFVNVNVVPMDRERVLADHTVLVKGGTIIALGPSGQIQAPAEAVQIDGRGKYLIPGLADMHAHFLASRNASKDKRRLFSYLAHGITTVREVNPVGRDEAQELMRLRMADVLGPRLYIAGDVPGLRWQTRAQPDSAVPRLDTAVAYLTSYMAAGYDFLSVTGYSRMASQSRETRMIFDSLLAAARQLGLPVSSHDNSGESPELLAALGAAGGSIEHVGAFRDLLTRPNESVSDAELQARAAATRRAGVWITVTMDCVEVNKKPTGNVQLARRLVKALQEAGVGLLVGADAPGGVGFSASVVHFEMAALGRAGLTPYQALLAGTRNVAQYLGRLDSSGTVAVEKWADLVLLHGNPLQDIRHVRELAGVMIAGRWLDRAALDRGLLDSPAAWFKTDVLGGLVPKTTEEQREPVGNTIRTIKRLADSLEAVRAMGRDTTRTTQHIVQELTGALGALRAVLTPEQREGFDPAARVWLREQARQGYRVTIPGIASAP